MTDTDAVRREFKEWFDSEYPADENGSREKYRDSNVMQLMQAAYQAGRADKEKTAERLTDEIAMLKAERDAYREGMRRARMDLEEERKDTERLDYLDKNRIGLFTVVNVMRRPTTRPSPRYEEVHEFAGWSTQNRNDEMPTARAAIDAAMNKGAENV